MTKKKTVRNERTSKGVASKAARVMRTIDAAQAMLLNMSRDLGLVFSVLDECKSVAASALTQAPDRKKKVK